MIQFILRIVVWLGRGWSYLFPKGMARVFSSLRDKLFTGYVMRRFAHFGHSIMMWKPLHLEGEQYVSIGDNCIFEPHLQLTAWKRGSKEPNIVIGDNCLIRPGTHITAVDSITIGHDLLTGTNVFITDNSHGLTDAASMALSPRVRPIVSKGAVVIGNNVWLGNNVCIMPGVTIGDNAIVGANSVVTHDVPPFAVVAGVPAKVINVNKK